ncbi:hypothetical protein COLO4_15659 [Corchorus olitorius]|uniref:Uncharacterized protein n=1 Tax=Corchorus olitorius TaxID=93759 RepID=A0A1R3JM67_9ROSI|nr:hypothetical protein COLO4_15659 [Corchorus olitorius]
MVTTFDQNSMLSTARANRHIKFEVSGELEPQPPRKLQYFNLSDPMLHLSLVNFQETFTFDKTPKSLYMNPNFLS